jgi:small-conductance mechanosensitive channel
MPFLTVILHQLREVPEYFLALKGALAVLAMGLPIYIGLRYFMFRRQLKASLSLTIGYIGLFLLYGGLTFLLASPLAHFIEGPILTTYLFITCVLTALTIVELIDLFLIQHYFTHVKKMYVSPPLRTIIKLTIFLVSILPILHFVLHFNPLALVAIPTIASAGVAFALQDTLKAFIAGVGIGHLIRLGEWISYQGKEGRVIDVNWARTTLENADGQRVYIPNNLLLTGVFMNYSMGNPSTLQIFKISASHDTSPVLVKDTLAKCVQGVTGIAKTPSPQMVVMEYAESGIQYGLYYWLVEYTQKLTVQDDLATRIWYAFRREGINVPFPTRVIQMQKESELSANNTTRIQESLQKWSLAEAFFAEELQELSRWARPRTYAPGETIIRRGDEGCSLFVLVDGSVEVFRDKDEVHAVATLGPRDIFGEMSLLTGEPRSATVKAKSSTELLEIEKGGLQKIIARRPELSDRLADMVVKRRSSQPSSTPELTQEPVPNGSDISLAKKIRLFFGLS